MIGVPSHFFKVVVLAADTDALLGVRGADVVPLARSEEDILELVHPGIRKEQGGVTVRDHRRAGNDPVSPLLEEAEKTLSDFAGFHQTSICVIRAISSRIELTSTHLIISPT